jgi:CubicO group peptidase (beta-lactamase class C family)
LEKPPDEIEAHLLRMTSPTVDHLMNLIAGQHRRRGACAQICVIRRDEVVLDRTLGCAPDALFLIYSASKPVVALLVHGLAERGQVSLDDPVAAHWPQLAQHGKGSITIRHVLQHRAGIPITGGLLATLAHMHDWNKSVRDAERAKPRWPAGQVPAYHFISYGFILGELVQRVTGRPIREVLSSQFLKPLGLDDLHLGLPDHALPRAVPVVAGHPSEIINQWQFNRRRVRQAAIPAASISSNARQLARFYHMLVRGGELDGVRVLEPGTVVEARKASSDGIIDAFIKRPVRWAQGFQLGGPGKDPRDVTRVMGMASSPETFGHAGNASCLAWADPNRRLVLVYFSNIQPGIEQGFQHLSEISDAVLAAFD